MEGFCLEWLDLIFLRFHVSWDQNDEKAFVQKHGQRILSGREQRVWGPGCSIVMGSRPEVGVVHGTT